jgi:thioredoxin 1
MPREVTDASFDEDVLSAGMPVVVDFWAPWCRPCDAIEPILLALEQEAAEAARFVRLNVDENPIAAARWGVLSLPTVILFDRGEARETIVGAKPRKHFEEKLGPWL